MLLVEEEDGEILLYTTAVTAAVAGRSLPQRHSFLKAEISIGSITKEEMGMQEGGKATAVTVVIEAFLVASLTLGGEILGQTKAVALVGAICLEEEQEAKEAILLLLATPGVPTDILELLTRAMDFKRRVR